MNYNPKAVGGGYLQSAVRIEHRPGRPPRPEDKDELLEQLEYLHEAGVQAWWYSVSGKGSFPLFPSKYLPHHPDAVPGMYEWMAEEIHKRDMVAFSWEYMNTAPYYIAEHPEDRMQFLKLREPTPADQREAALARINGTYNCGGSPVPCYLSPYGQLLKDFCVEVVTDLGWDGLWFDGSMFMGVWGWPDGRIGCCCERCQKAFYDDTGLHIPEYEDLSDPDFREFVKWRYRFFGEYWRELCDYVRDHSATGLIALNNFQCMSHPYGESCPLHTLNIDGLVASEIRQRPFMLSLMMKFLRAVSDVHTPEVWIAQTPGGPNSIPDDMIYYGMLCMTSGGFSSMGLSGGPRHNVTTLRAIGDALKPRAPYVGGDPVRYVGMLLSVSTIDFAYPGDSEKPWRSAYGMHNMLQHAHLPGQPVLDDQGTTESLAAYPVVALSDVRCLSDEQAQALEQYVKQGGLLIATANTGILDENGWPRERPVLDDLLGIMQRRDDPAPGNITPQGEWADGLPDYLNFDPGRTGEPPNTFEPNVWAEFSDDVEVLALSREPSPSGGQVHTSEPVVSDPPPAIVTREVGEGRVIYINRNLGHFYSRVPRPLFRDVVRRLIATYAPSPPFSVQALPHVVVEAWRQADGRIFFHILSQPEDLRYVPGDWSFRAPINLCTIPPGGPVTITLPFAASAVSLPVSDNELQVATADGKTTITVAGWDKHEIVVVEP